jgi:hypothetical protein
MIGRFLIFQVSSSSTKIKSKLVSNFRCFIYTNLSNKIQLVNNKILSKFESVKLKNKSPMCLSSNMFFFIYSKSFLLSYYKNRIEKLSKRNNNKRQEPESIEPGASGLGNNNGKIFPVTQAKGNQQIITSHTPHVHLKSQPKKKKILAAIKKPSDSNRVTTLANSSITLNYGFESILQPPSKTGHSATDAENILDDLIESPNKLKISNINK